MYTETDTSWFTGEEKTINHGLYRHERFIIHHESEIGTSHHMRKPRNFIGGEGGGGSDG